MTNIFSDLKSIADYQRAEDEFQLKKQQALATKQGVVPAAIQIADAYQKARDAGNSQRMHDIEQFSKIVDRGFISNPQGGYMSAPGYDEALAQREALKRG